MINPKTFAFVIFTLIGVNSVVSDKDAVFGVPVLRNSLRAANKCQGPNLFQCSVGCDSLMVCGSSSTEPILIQKCQASTPYCDSTDTSAVCQSRPGENCKISTASTCTGSGYFPDVEDCTKYNLCAAANKHLKTYQCPTGFVYSSKEVLCRRSINCVRVRCPTTGAIISPYTPNPEFYYICQPNKPAKVYKCPGEGEIFMTGVGCIFICPAEGIYQRNETSFYFCYREGTALRHIVYTCPSGTVFDKDTKRCKFSTTTTTGQPSTEDDMGGIELCTGINASLPISTTNNLCERNPCTITNGATIELITSFKTSATSTMTFNINAYMNGVPLTLDLVPNDHKDACKGLINGSCPTKDGDVVTHKVTVPVVSPVEATLDMEFYISDRNGKALFCYRTTVSIKK